MLKKKRTKATRQVLEVTQWNKTYAIVVIGYLQMFGERVCRAIKCQTTNVIKKKYEGKSATICASII